MPQAASGTEPSTARRAHMLLGAVAINQLLPAIDHMSAPHPRLQCTARAALQCKLFGHLTLAKVPVAAYTALQAKARLPSTCTPTHDRHHPTFQSFVAHQRMRLLSLLCLPDGLQCCYLSHQSSTCMCCGELAGLCTVHSQRHLAAVLAPDEIP